MFYRDRQAEVQQQNDMIGQDLNCLPLIQQIRDLLTQGCGIIKFYYYRTWPNYGTVHLGFSKLAGKLVVKYDSTYQGYP